MEDIYLLSQLGHYSIADILDLTPTERAWFLNRLARDLAK